MKKHWPLLLVLVLAALFASRYAASSRFWLGGGGRGGPPAGPPKNWFGAKLEGIDAKQGGGINVVRVYRGSPADKGGLKPGDVIASVDGRPVTVAELRTILDQAASGTKLSIAARRGDGSTVLLEVVLQGSGGREEVLATTAAQGARALAGLMGKDGRWPHYHDPSRTSVATTALAVYALAATGPDGGDQAALAIERGLASLYAARGEDGALDEPGATTPHRCYANACLVMALAALDRTRGDHAHAREIERLVGWLLWAQVDERWGLDPLDWRFGGWPYHEGRSLATLRTDVSTAAWVLEALAAARLPDDHAAWGRAARFLDRCQNFEPTTPRDAKLRDGGFAFGPRFSKAGQTAVADDVTVFKSYGSATADGARGLVALAGERPVGDPRLEASLRWLARSYVLERNPGFAPDDQVGWAKGLELYWVAALSRALDGAKVDVVKSKDVEHRWAEEVVTRLATLALPNGLFATKSSLMGEDSPTVATSFALLALASARERLRARDGRTVEASAAAIEPPGALLEKPSDDQVERGAAIYRRINCDSCHAPGNGNGPDLTNVGARYLERFFGRQPAAKYLKSHIRDPKTYRGFTKGFEGREMPAFSALPDQELEDLVAYLLSRTGSQIEGTVGGDALRGQTLARSCLKCHEVDKNVPTLRKVFERRRVAAQGDVEKARAALVEQLMEHPAGVKRVTADARDLVEYLKTVD